MRRDYSRGGPGLPARNRHYAALLADSFFDEMPSGMQGAADREGAER